jgi:hypothetical protein
VEKWHNGPQVKTSPSSISIYLTFHRIHCNYFRAMMIKIKYIDRKLLCILKYAFAFGLFSDCALEGPQSKFNAFL